MPKKVASILQASGGGSRYAAQISKLQLVNSVRSHNPRQSDWKPCPV